MVYIRLDTKALTNGKLLAVGPLGFALYVKGLLYSKEHMTDGFVPKSAVDLLAIGIKGVPKVIASLVTFGLWIECDGGWTVSPDRWAEYQQTAAQVAESREAAAERKRKSRERSQRDTPAPSDGGHTNVTRDKNEALSKPKPEPKPEPEPEIIMESANALSARAWFEGDDSPGGALAREIASTKIAGGKTPYAEGERLKYLTRQRCDDLAKRIRTLDPGGDEVEHLTQAWHEHHDGKRTPPYKDAVRALGDWVSQREANWKRLQKTRQSDSPQGRLDAVSAELERRRAAGGAA